MVLQNRAGANCQRTIDPVRQNLLGHPGIELVRSWLIGIHQDEPATAVTGKFSGPDRESRLIAGARKEGTLTVYSSLPVEAMRDVTNGFARKYAPNCTASPEAA